MAWTDNFLVSGDSFAAIPVQSSAPTLYTAPATTSTVTPSGYTAPATQAAGAQLAAQESGGLGQFAGLFGAILTPMAQAVASRIARPAANNPTATSGTVAPAVGAGLNSGQIVIAVGLGLAALFVGLLLLKRA